MAPAVDVAAPVAAQPDISVAGSAVDATVATKTDPTPAPKADPPPTPKPDPIPTPKADPPPPVPSDGSFHHTREHDGLRWIVDAHLDGSKVLELVATTALHNIGDTPAAISSPPAYTVQWATIPGQTIEGFGALGIRGEGWGSVCWSPKGDLPTVAPGERVTLPPKRVKLDPLPWPSGQASHVTLRVRDCRSKTLVLDVLDVLVIPPATRGGKPTLQAVEARPGG